MSRTTLEKRSHARFTHRFEIEGPAGDGGTVARMVSRDLSLGGLQCSSSHDYPEMTRIAVRLHLPGDEDPEPINVESVVVRRSKLDAIADGERYELALFFTSMSDVCRERIARFLARSASN